MNCMDTMAAHLRYIETGRLRTLDDRLDGAVVLGPADAVLGTLAGVLIDPLNRRLSYLIVESHSWFARHHHVVPFDVVQVDRGRNALRVAAGADRLREVRVDRLARFSDEDAIEAMFRPRAA